MRRAPIVAVLALCLALPAAALADGDPASDVLPIEDVFTPYPAPATAKDLQASVAKAFAAGQRVKVAVIGSRRDLGSIPSLWGKPSAYARFLGEEISAFYTGPLVIVMPSGFGVFDAHHSTSAESAALAKQKIDRGSAASLVSSAASAVDALVAAGALHSPDVQAPQVYSEPAVVRRGRKETISYHVLENSERSSETVTVYAGKNRLAVLRSPMQPTSYEGQHQVSWNVPADAPKSGVRYCIVAADPSGNRSKPTCFKLTVK